MKKDDLVKALSEQTDLPLIQVERVLNALTETGMKQLRERGEFSLTGLGKLRSVRLAERMGRNPKTGAPAPIAARTTVRIKPSSLLLTALN